MFFLQLVHGMWDRNSHQSSEKIAQNKITINMTLLIHLACLVSFSVIIVNKKMKNLCFNITIAITQYSLAEINYGLINNYSMDFRQ